VKTYACDIQQSERDQNVYENTQFTW